MEAVSSNFSHLGQNAGYAEELYKLYLLDPKLVPDAWAKYFANFTQHNGGAQNVPPQVTVALRQNAETNGGIQQSTVLALPGADAVRENVSQKKVYQLVHAYRSRGHLLAMINPLSAVRLRLPDATDLGLAYYAFTQAELDESFYCDGFMGFERMKLGDLLRELTRVYAGALSIEFDHIHNLEERSWLQSRIEGRFADSRYASREERLRILEKLAAADVFEAELHKKYVGHKRFSLQGNDTLIPMLDVAVERAYELGIHDITIGMPHRGRLTVLAYVLGKPMGDIFAEFEDATPATVYGAGDVKYHLGHQGTYRNSAGNEIAVSVACNPSHLEAINPVVQGMVRAKQDKNFRGDRRAVLPLLLHGDAAVVGQGMVAETFNLAYINGYSAGGTLHIVVNNQVGFTTNPEEYRSTPYCTEIAKAIQAPVLHVNSEDPEACCWAMDLALEYRQQFGRDVMIDMYGYRKYGHNEADDPSYTQPLMYAEVARKDNLSTIYGRRLVSEAVLADSEVEDVKNRYVEEFKQAHEGRRHKEGKSRFLDERVEHPDTKVSAETLDQIAHQLVRFPDGFNVHPKLIKILEKGADLRSLEHGIEWALAEKLAFGSLLLDGVSVRLAGQDSARGTFSQRHLVLSDVKTNQRFCPLQAIAQEKGGVTFEVYNSPLSEEAVMGFEFGYASEAKRSLIMWEAQFGDFANEAQVIIDQFVSSAENKWGQRSGLTLLLPHGYEGQGPEHSSARLERYLQLCAEGNMTVCYPTSAAQWFHLLRRQGLLQLQRPLVVMTPKYLLRLPEATSKLEELASSEFQSILVEDIVSAKQAKSVVFTSGKIFYELRKALTEQKAKVQIVRIEEIYPFPTQAIQKVLKRCQNAKQCYWVQEEPKNMGAWSFIADHMKEELDTELYYVGRPAAASTATGSPKRHAEEQKAIVSEVVKLVGSGKASA